MRVDVVPLEEQMHDRRVCYKQVKKACGRRSCSLCHGTLRAHGPYWLLVEWDETGRRTCTKQIGRQLPPEAEEGLRLRRLLADPTFRQLVYRTEELVQELAWGRREVGEMRQRVARLEAELAEARVTGRQRPPSLGDVGRLTRPAKVWRKLASKYHPDRDPTKAEVMQDLNELWHAVKEAFLKG